MLTLLFSLGVCASQAQRPPAIDSLKRVITAAQADTTKLAAMLALSELIYPMDPDTNLVICRDAFRRIEYALKKVGVTPKERKVFLVLKAKTLNNMAASYYTFGQLDSALILFQQAERIHATNGETAGAADAIINQGLLYGIMGKHAEQRRCLFKALEVYQRAKDPSSTGYALNNIGNYYGEHGLPDSALTYLDSSLQTFTRITDQRGMASSLLNIGMNYKDRGRTAEALERFLRCEKIFERLGDKTGLATCLNNIATIYRDQGIPSEALEYLHRALDMNTALGDRLSAANNRMNIGSLLDDHGELDLALEEFNKSLAIYTEIGDRSGEALVHGHIGNVWKNKGDRKKALEHFLIGMKISHEVERPEEISTATYKLGHFLEDIGELDTALVYYNKCLAIDERIKDRESEAFALYSIAAVKLKQGKAVEAEDFAERSLAVARELGFPLNIMRATQVLNEALAKQGKWGRALEMLELHEQMKDSVQSAENAKKTVRLQMRYTFEKEQLADSLAHVAEMGELENEKRIATLEGEQARNRTWAFGFVGLLLLGGGGAVYRLDRRRRQEKFERDAARLQTQILRTQMNPHFIFNALNSINNYVQTSERDLASGFLTKFARLMRLVLENSRHTEVPLAQDLEALRLYMDLERARMNEKFDYTVDVDPTIDQEITLVPPLVVQPFVENAIWHGISRKEGKGHIKLSVYCEDTRLIMTIEDDGVGRQPGSTSPPESPTKTSLGTAITRDRLTLLGKQRGGDAGFRFTDLEQGTRVVVEIPVLVA
ncbi:MAG: tetratricopeptide repeat protein [Flavobacteriales bacterium]